MNINFNNLAASLKSSILPVYLISGDEPLQMGEACDAIRTHLRANDYIEREVMHVDKNFDWNRLSAASCELSLFATRRIIELRMPGGKPGDKGSKALVEYAQRPAEDTVLLLVSGKLDKAQQKSKWFTALDNIGACVSVWPVEVGQLPGWLQRRLQSKGLKVTPEALEMLAERAEGNLLAAAQEVEKIALLCESGTVDADAVVYCVTDSARYDIYALVDVALEGKVQRVVRMLSGLRAEGTEAILVLWALSREIRSLLPMAQALQAGQRLDTVMRQGRVWAKRTAIVSKALQRHRVEPLQHLLQWAARIDRMIKGVEAGNVWDELLQLSVMLAGARVMSRAPIGTHG
ncbi:MAG: DNA polymerase III subunit delta [Gammaproteobacteria bacterium]|nr:DNA polymerase III subunit delta [Gammaproteobacteria bacterium]MDH5799729.1 DNA polymerase III subunit delta [Gammaproteobacteria bacterium]